MDTKKMRVCSYLLPDPGGEVVRECLDEIDRLREALQPFANVGGWFFARPQVLDETPVVGLIGINGQAGSLTRGQFKAANLAMSPNAKLPGGPSGTSG